MKITEMNAGEKISYELDKYRLTFGEELSVRLDKYQRDYEVTKDIMADGDGSLVIGDGRYYIAQIIIPAAEYDEVEGENEESTEKVKKPLDTDDVELKLFSIDGILN